MTQFRLLVLGNADLLTLGTLKDHKQSEIEIIRTPCNREWYFAGGKFVSTPQLQKLIDEITASSHDGVVICHNRGWGLGMVQRLAPAMERKMLVVDRTRLAYSSYPPGIETGVYSDCWDWIIQQAAKVAT